jgi:hypothetical protein
MLAFHAVPLLVILSTVVQAATENSPLSTEIPQESKSEGDNGYIVPLLVVLTVALIGSLTLVYFYRSRFKSFLKPSLRDVAVSSSTQEIEMSDMPNDDLEMSRVLRNYEIVPGMVYDVGKDELKIISLISAGDNPWFGNIWRAKYNGREVAVKTIKEASDLKHMRKLERRMKREASFLSEMQHERIVLFIGFRLVPLSLVTEYLPLGTLRSLIAEGTDIIRWELRYQMMLDICEGMDFIHTSAEELHQDLKTVTVLLEMADGRLRAKISEFGMSCI